MRVQRISLVMALVAGLGIGAVGTSSAAEAPPARPALKLNRDAAKGAEPAEAGQSDAKAESPADDDKEKKVDRFAVPEGGVAELLGFIQSMLKFSPTSREEFVEYRERGFKAMKEAAEKVRQIASDEDKKLPGYDEVDGLLLYFRSEDAAQATPDERQALVHDLKTYFAATVEPTRYARAAAQQVASALEYGGKPAEAIPVYQELGAAMAASRDEATAKAGLKMEGAARRLDLVGKPLEIAGTEFDGKKFDWNSLRGKVVLVDFWATWCGPCRGEIPNVKKNYELYHDKGFEVVGISLDDDRAALEKFLAEEQNPWITLHDGGWNDNDTATHYGIMGIPTVILVDKEGKVVSTRARGPELGRLLAELLGPAAESKSEDN